MKEIKEVKPNIWEIPTSYKKTMKVPARIVASKAILESMDEGVFDQLTNVASLPGIFNHAYCMPDGHWGYGFPIGGVAAFDKEEGVISPGGIGFDINCGMRLLTTPLTAKNVKPELKRLINYLFKTVPAGVGHKGMLTVSNDELDEVMTNGLDWALKNNYANKNDVLSAEANGRIKQADPEKVSDRARARGRKQLGTLGSGNHYLEVQTVNAKEIFDEERARLLGLKPEQVVIMIHSGSRGFGHQIASDYLKTFEQRMNSYNIEVNDKQLAAVPFQSEEGQDYYKAMAAGANFGFVNRQLITHRVREAFNKLFKVPMDDLKLVYDVAHNIAKLEKHKIEGKKREVLVHRKGATRSFGPSSMTGRFVKTGQPVILGGSMETGSYLLTGTDEAMNLTFGSTAHGSGRVMSRTQAKRQFTGEKLEKQMMKKGIYVKAVSMKGLAEEAGAAYKNIDSVVDTVDKAKISKKVAALRPIGNVKG